MRQAKNRQETTLQATTRCTPLLWRAPLPTPARTTYSEGDRVGVIVKFSHKGLIWKSWEGEMQLGGVKAARDGAVPNVWEFSLRRGEEKDLVQKLSQAQDSGKRIKVRYRQAMLGLLGLGVSKPRPEEPTEAPLREKDGVL